VNNEASGGAEQRRATARAYQRLAPALEDLIVIDMPQLTPEAFRPFVGHPTLRQAAIGLGSIKKNRQARAALGLPQIEGKFVFTPGDEEQSRG